MNFTFRAEWLEAAKALNNPTLEAELLMAIVTYGTTGQLLQSSTPIVNALMIVVKSQIDSAPQRKKQLKRHTMPDSADTSNNAISPSPAACGEHKPEPSWCDSHERRTTPRCNDGQMPPNSYHATPYQDRYS